MKDYYTKKEVDALIVGAVEEAREIDRVSMARHEGLGNYPTFYGY